MILFDNAGVAASTGETPDTIDAMADHAADFIGALGLANVDLLGFSIGGYIAQTLALRRPELIRRLILAGTGPRAGEPPQDPKYGAYGASTDPETGELPIEAFLYLFFRPSETSQAAARAFWARRHMRERDVDPPTSAQTMAAQRAAITEWRQPRGERFAELKAINQPTLVVNGHNDSSSSGEVPTTFEQMGANAIAFSRALGLNKADVLGFSIGGMVAQEITLQAPDLVRKLILVGTGPRGGQGMELLTQVAQRIFGARL